jgi:hypothetical protein
MLADVRAATTVQVLNDADCAIGGFAGGARLGSVQSASVTGTNVRFDAHQTRQI